MEPHIPFAICSPIPSPSKAIGLNSGPSSRMRIEGSSPARTTRSMHLLGSEPRPWTETLDASSSQHSLAFSALSASTLLDARNPDTASMDSSRSERSPLIDTASVGISGILPRRNPRRDGSLLRIVTDMQAMTASMIASPIQNEGHMSSPSIGARTNATAMTSNGWRTDTAIATRLWPRTWKSIISA